MPNSGASLSWLPDQVKVRIKPLEGEAKPASQTAAWPPWPRDCEVRPDCSRKGWASGAQRRALGKSFWKAARPVWASSGAGLAWSAVVFAVPDGEEDSQPVPRARNAAAKTSTAGLNIRDLLLLRKL